MPEAQPWVPRLAAVLEQVDAADASLNRGVLIENKGATRQPALPPGAGPGRARGTQLLEILAQRARQPACASKKAAW